MRPYVAVSLKKRNDEDPWGVMQAVLDYGDRVGKMIVAVDEDINVKDPIAVTWAITHRSQPHRDVKIVRDRPFGATPIGMVATHPSSRYDNSESSLLIDATRKADFPPLSLPKEEFMVRAKEIWEELGLPKLEPQEPWHGYLMGLWPENFDHEAELAARSEHEKVWEISAPNPRPGRRRRDHEIDARQMGQDAFRAERNERHRCIGRKRKSTSFDDQITHGTVLP